MALGRSHELNRTMSVLIVIPVNEVADPFPPPRLSSPCLPLVMPAAAIDRKKRLWRTPRQHPQSVLSLQSQGPGQSLSRQNAQRHPRTRPRPSRRLSPKMGGRCQVRRQRRNSAARRINQSSDRLCKRLFQSSRSAFGSRKPRNPFARKSGTRPRFQPFLP
jgi:hypothetical protein